MGKIGLAFLVCACLLLSGAAYSQTINASLTGIVTDSSGAVIPNAKVQIVSTATNAQTDAITSADGAYQAPSLPAGTYVVTVSAGGFKTAKRNDVVLDVSQTARLDISLEVGAVSESVDVTAQSEVVDSTTSSVGAVVDSTAMSNLPLNTRNPFSLVFLVPGVTGSVDIGYNTDNFSANGGRPGTSEVLIDGSPSSPPGGVPINVLSIFPSVDAMQEFRVQTSNYSAEFGRSGSGIINMVFKSGTNQLHGTAFELLRNSITDANTFFNNKNGVSLSSFKRNQFGFTLGGPVIIPKLYNGHNKTFFFGDYEGLRQITPSTNQDTVPTDLQRAGDFSQTFNQNGQRVLIYDPLTTTQSGNSYVRAPFAGNVIPSSRIDAVSLNVMKYYPLPTGAGDPFTATNNFYMAGKTVKNVDQGDVKVDQYFGSDDRLFVRVSRRDYANPADTGIFPSDLRVAQGGSGQDQIGSGASADYSHNFSPSFLSELRLGFGRSLIDIVPTGYGFDPTQLGFPTYIRENAQVIAFPGFNPANYLAIGNGGADFRHSSYNTYNILFSNSKVSGNHIFKFGWEGRRMEVDNGEAQAMDGNFSFNNTITQGPDPTKATNTGGNSLASMLLGIGSGTMTQNSKIADTQSYYYAWYFADDWKVSRRLTLNLGIRYEIEVPRTERHNRMNYFDPNVASPLAGPAGIPGLKGGIEFLGVNGIGNRQFPIPWKEIAPRLGFAYQLNSKTILRGGGGIFYTPGATKAGGVVGNFGFRTDTTYTGSSDGLTPQVYLDNPFPTGLVPPTGSSLGLLSQIGQAIQEPIPTDRIPYTENWSFGIQRELPGAILVDASYVGNHGVQLISSAEGNQNLNQLTAQQMALGSAVLQQVPNPFYGLIATGVLSTKTIPQYYLLRKYPQFASVGMLYPQGSNSSYNAFQLKVTKRFKSGLQFMLAYADQKQIDDSSIIENVGAQAAGQDLYCRRCDRAVSANNISQRFVYSSVYELPFGRHRHWGASWNPFVNAVLGGWQANGILTLQTGFPLNILNGANTTLGSANAGNWSLRPNNNGQSAALSGEAETRLNQYFNTSVFSLAAPFTFGNTGRTLPDVRGPGTTNLDGSFFKSFVVRERVTAQFRVEAFNASNTPKFNNPNTTANSNQFGRITAAGSARQLQMGLKLLF